MRNLWACHRRRKHPYRKGHYLELTHDVEFNEWRVEEFDKEGELYGFDPFNDNYSTKTKALKEFARREKEKERT